MCFLMQSSESSVLLCLCFASEWAHMSAVIVKRPIGGKLLHLWMKIGRMCVSERKAFASPFNEIISAFFYLVYTLTKKNIVIDCLRCMQLVCFWHIDDFKSLNSVWMGSEHEMLFCTYTHFCIHHTYAILKFFKGN